MTTNHIDQLAQWWDEAEVGVIEKGDTVINRSEGETTVYVATVRAHRQHPSARILARAPKPAWHDAPAVIATGDVGDGDWITGVWVPDGTPERWESAETGIILRCEGLSDVVPLIGAKVTDEMVARAMKFWDPNCPGEHDADDIQWAREFITAALGLETA